jgi:hypothetical protein
MFAARPGIEPRALVVECVPQLVADRTADRAIIDRRIGLGIEHRRLQKRAVNKISLNSSRFHATTRCGVALPHVLRSFGLPSCARSTAEAHRAARTQLPNASPCTISSAA